MPSAEFFAGLGLFVAEGFLDGATCRSIRDEAAMSPAQSVGVYDGVHKVDVTQRSTNAAQVSDLTIAQVTDRLLAIRPDVERHFDIALQECQPPRVLVYQPRDFFKIHVDRGRDDGPRYVQERLVSVVVFLNDEAETGGPDSYAGGSLTFYNLIADERFENCGLPIAGREGLLVAFRADLPHAVTPVTHGRRFTIVTWFC